jgi:hypothetical protein
MTARKVHAVLAAGVNSPHLITQWQKDPSFLISQGIEPRTIDLNALWSFTGLTLKVRHNGTRQELPLSFRYMSIVGLDLHVFASYAAFCTANGYHFAPTPQGRTRDLVAFLEQWLDLEDRSHSILWDLLRHEQALTQLNLSTSQSETVDYPNVVGQTRSGSSVPFVCGDIVLLNMRCDPRVVESALFQKTMELNDIPPGDRLYCYWRSGQAPEIQILELNEFGYYVLASVDGIRSVADLSHRLVGSRRATPGFLQLLNQLAGVGVLQFRSAFGTKVK